MIMGTLLCFLLVALVVAAVIVGWALRGFREEGRDGD
jgi:hypothetical protein